MILQQTRSVCTTCHMPIPAQVVRIDDEVRLEKSCPEHGAHSARLADDADLYTSTLLPRQHPPLAGGCTASAGKTLLLEITDGCNLSCPTCLTTSSPQGRWELGVDELAARLDALSAEPGWGDGPRVYRLSGGEPTMHPRLGALIDLCFARGAERVTLETNGLRLAGDAALVAELARHQGKLDIDLQLDGFRPQTSRALRGVDGLLRVKLRGLFTALEHGIGVRLLTTLRRDLNLDELGSLLRFALEHHPGVHGWLVQAASLNGRLEGEAGRREERLTTSEIARELARQSDGMLRAEDFGPLTDADPACLSLVRGVVRDARLEPLRGARLEPLRDARLEPLRDARLEPLRDARGSEHAALFTIGIRSMMDAENYDGRRVDGCRTHVVARGGACRSFCEHNVLFRRA